MKLKQNDREQLQDLLVMLTEASKTNPNLTDYGKERLLAAVEVVQEYLEENQ